MNAKLWLAALSLMVPAALAVAEDAKAPESPPTTAPPAPEKDRDADKDRASRKTNRGTQKQVDTLAAEFKVAPADIEALHAKGLGWGEIRHAYAIAQKANVPVADVVAQHKAGMGWGKIADKYGFSLGSVSGKDRGAAGAEGRAGHEPHGGGHGPHGGRR